MLKNVFGHWKSTLAGAGLAALQVALAGVNWKAILVAAGTAFLGAIVKDPGSKPPVQ